MSMQKACWVLPARGSRSLRSTTPPQVEVEAVVGAQRQRGEVGIGEERIEVDGTGGGRLLEERVVEVPRPQLVDPAAEPLGLAGIELVLPRGERFRRRGVDLGEGGEETLLVELAGGEREREVVPVPEAAGRLVAGPDQLAELVGHRRAHLLRRLPRGPAGGGVVARGEHGEDRVVVDGLAVDLAAERVEGGVDRGLELHDARAQLGRHLVRSERVVQHRRPGAARSGSRSASDRAAVSAANASTSAYASRSASSASVRRASFSGDASV